MMGGLGLYWIGLLWLRTGTIGWLSWKR